MIDLSLILDSSIIEKNVYVDYILGNYRHLDDLYSRLESLYGRKFHRQYLKCNVQHLRHLVKYNIIPLEENKVTREITFGTYIENKNSIQKFLNEIDVPATIVTISIFDFIEIYKELIGEYPNIINVLPPKDFFSIYIEEGIKLKASDITIYSTNSGYRVDYKINKRTVKSKITLPVINLNEVVEYMVTNNNSTRSSSNKNKVIYLTDDYSKYTRLRTAINYTYYGYEITCRFLSKELSTTTLSNLNLPDEYIKFIRENIIKKSNGGLNVICGPTSSGKNTTIIATLKETLDTLPQKIVSVENPVEILLDGLIQIETKNEEEFIDSIRSLIRQDPDYVYITEITDITCKETLKIANTGKAILSSVHSNSCSDTISRLIDLAVEFTPNDIIRLTNCIIHQQLIPKICPHCKDQGCEYCHLAGVIPLVSGIYLSNSIKEQLLNKSNSDIIQIIKNNTIYFNDLDNLYSNGIISEKTYRRVSND